MGDLLHNSQLHRLVRQKPQRPAIATSWRFGAGQGDQVRFGTALQRTPVDRIGLRAFQRGLQTSFVLKRSRALWSVAMEVSSIWAIFRSLSFCASACLPTSALSRMRARFNLRAGALPEEMSLCKYSRCCSLRSTRYFFFI